MVQELLPMLPKELGTLALVLAVAGAMAGVGLWLVGSRFSRSLVTLLLVSVGGWTGLFFPRWFGWAIDGWAPAVGLAVVLGAAGFFMHRFWVGMGLGLLLAAWAAVVTWLLCKGDAAWSWPRFDQYSTLPQFAQDLWAGLPVAVAKYLPFASGAAMLSGLLAGLLWPRVGVSLLYSVLGVTMIVALGLSAANLVRPQWIGWLPAKTSQQGGLLLAMVAFGALLQWRIAPAPKGPAKPAHARKPMVVEHDD